MKTQPTAIQPLRDYLQYPEFYHVESAPRPAFWISSFVYSSESRKEGIRREIEDFKSETSEVLDSDDGCGKRDLIKERNFEQQNLKPFFQKKYSTVLK